jgi:hypothetical protein
MHGSDFEDKLVELAEWRNNHLFGKYRGLVTAVEEGDLLGFISARIVPYGEEITIDKLRPCSPFAGAGHGLVALPEVGDGVWVEFEGGNPSLPIWSGFWWADDEIPEPKGPLIRTFITTAGHKLILDDDGNEVKLLHKDGGEMTMTDSDITIKIGESSITLTSDDITLKSGSTSTVKMTSSEISVDGGGSGTVKVTTSGVNIGNGAVKTS